MTTELPSTPNALRERLRSALGAPADVRGGFSDGGTPFQPEGAHKASLDEIRFAESVRLARTFAAIEDTADRKLALALVMALAEARQP